MRKLKKHRGPPRVLVCGSRDWEDKEAIRRELEKFPKGTVVIHGMCRGADLLADAVAIELGFAIMPFLAKWDDYGPAAGPIRNKEMLRIGEPSLVLAFHEDLEASKGTYNMVGVARKAGVKVKVFDQ